MPTYKDEKTGTWFVKCYYTDYIGNKKQKKKRGFARQKDAKEWEYNFLSSLQYDSTTTFGSIAADFIAENTRTVYVPVGEGAALVERLKGV